MADAAFPYMLIAAAYAVAGLAIGWVASRPNTMLSDDGPPPDVGVFVWIVVGATWPLWVAMWTWNTWRSRG